MTYLLDVNVLIALVDLAHVHHAAAQDWFTSLDAGWATCPITEIGVVRILSNSAYRNALKPLEVIEALEQLQRLGRHEFWSNDVSLLDFFTFSHWGLQRSRQITDSYLLGLAVAHGGKLATLDSRMSTAGVHNGSQALVLIPS